MVDYMRGKLQRADKKVLYRDEKQVLRDTKELIRQTKRDMFSPAKLTLRQIVARDNQIDHQLDSLETMRDNVFVGHAKYAELQSSKRELKAQKKLVRMEMKSRILHLANDNLDTTGEDNEE